MFGLTVYLHGKLLSIEEDKDVEDLIQYLGIGRRLHSHARAETPFSQSNDIIPDNRAQNNRAQKLVDPESDEPVGDDIPATAKESTRPRTPTGRFLAVAKPASTHAHGEEPQKKGGASTKIENWLELAWEKIGRPATGDEYYRAMVSLGFESKANDSKTVISSIKDVLRDSPKFERAGVKPNGAIRWAKVGYDVDASKQMEFETGPDAEDDDALSESAAQEPGFIALDSEGTENMAQDVARDSEAAQRLKTVEGEPK